MEKIPAKVERDLARLAGLIGDIRYADPPDSLTEKILAGLKPKKMPFFRRLWQRLRTPVPVTPLRMMPAGALVVALFALALTLFWRTPDERLVSQRINEGSDQGLRTVILFLDRPDATNVEVIGSFNNWSEEGVRMVWDKDRRLWLVTLNLRRGSYEYAFRVNGKEIIVDPKAILQRDDGFGHQNSILIIGNGNGHDAKI